jgi:hypothetical protein
VALCARYSLSTFPTTGQNGAARGKQPPTAIAEKRALAVKRMLTHMLNKSLSRSFICWRTRETEESVHAKASN